MNIVQNLFKSSFKLQLSNKQANLRGGVTAIQCYVPGCGYAGAPRSPRIDDLADISKPGDNSARSKIDITEKSSDRNYGTAATATSGRVLQEVPEPQGLPVVGSLFTFLLSGGAKKMHEYVDRRHAELGPVYRDRLGMLTAVYVNSPHEFRRIYRLEGPTPRHYIPDTWILYNKVRGQRRGLLFMDGEEWLHFRKILNKIMLVPDPTHLMAGPCEEVAKGLTRKWQLQIKNDSIVPDLQVQLYQWSIEVMMATLMGPSWSYSKHRLSKDFDKLARMLHGIFEHSADMYGLPAKLVMNLRLPVWKKFVACVDTAFDIVRDLVAEMTRLGGDGLLKKMMDEGIRDEDAVCIVTDFLLNAGDTTATTLQWILLLLCKHPERQEELFERVKDLSQKELLRDPLLKSTIKETLRLYPIASFISRYLPEDSVIDNYFVSKGELVVMSLYSSGRDHANFSRPNEFLPERWFRTEKGTYQGVLNPHASLPFAWGARSCIGRKLAETQITLALAELVKSFKIDCINKDQVKLILHLISIPSESMQLKLTQRDTGSM